MIKAILAHLAIFMFLPALIAQSIPEGYYDGTDGLTGEELKKKLHTIISNHTVRSYSEFRDVILPDLDEDPNNPDNLIVFYKNASVPKADFAVDEDSWNREHTWPSSHGFSSTTDTAYTDAHNLRPSDASVNTSKSNKDFNNVSNTSEFAEGEAPDTYTDADFWDPRDEIKGDVARILFYMDTRYNSERLDLKLVDRASFSGDPELGILYTLIQWHNDDPVDQSEIERHEGVYGYQKNRNPFVDHPEWVDQVFGSTTDPVLVVDELNFNRDFGVVEMGSSLTQQYTVNVYNHTEDITVSTISPFSVSVDGTTFSEQAVFTYNNQSSQSLTVYIKFTPNEQGITSSAAITHSVNNQMVTIEVSGTEGERMNLSILEARQKQNGEVVSVSGVVIDKGNNSSNSRVIYDGTAGIVVRSFDAGNESANLVYGDSINVTGGLGEYNNLLQISESPISINLLKSNATVPLADTLFVTDVNESVESQLVHIKGLTFDDAGGTFAGGGSAGNFIVTDEGGNELIFRIGSSDHPLVGTSIPSGIFDITGIVGQFGEDYQLSPRDSDDLTESVGSSGELVTIAQARRIGVGSRVQVTGVVIDKGNNSIDNRIIYDGTSGIVVRSMDEGNESANLSYGDSVIVTGGLSEFSGTLQIEDSPISITHVSQNALIPEAKTLAIEEIGEDVESQLVVISGVEFLESGMFARGDYTVTKETMSLSVRIGLDSNPLVGTEIPKGKIDITGIVAQNQTEYRILPRSLEDIQVVAINNPLSALNEVLFVYPNPVISSLIFSGMNGAKISIYDVKGTLLDERYLSDKEAVDMNDFEAGLYLVSIQTETNTQTFKVIKK